MDTAHDTAEEVACGRRRIRVAALALDSRVIAGLPVAAVAANRCRQAAATVDR